MREIVRDVFGIFEVCFVQKEIGKTWGWKYTQDLYMYNVYICVCIYNFKN